MGVWYAIISILAIIAGPIIAVQVQRKIDERRDKHNRKLAIFKTLMTTRAAPLSADHVNALNMIDVEFHDAKSILDAWREYHDHLGEQWNEKTFDSWASKNHDYLVKLLKVMGTTLGYDFDNVSLKKGGYLPTGHGRWDMANQIIRDQLVKVLTGEIPLRIASVPADQASEGHFKIVQQAIQRIFTGQQPISIKIVGPDEEPTFRLQGPGLLNMPMPPKNDPES